MEEPVSSLTDHVRNLTGLLGKINDPRVQTFSGLATSRVQSVERLMKEAMAATGSIRARPSPRRDSADLAGIISRSLARARAATGSKSAHSDGSLEEIVVRCDPMQLEQSLTGLLISLMNLAGPDEQIHVRLYSTAESGRMDVIKRGSGVPTAELSRLVSRFQTGGAATAASIRLVGGNVMADSGVIRARSSEGGTAFRVTLPRA